MIILTKRLDFHLLFATAVLWTSPICCLDFATARNSHQWKQYNSNTIEKIAEMGDNNLFKTQLKPILVPRVVGTESHATVRQYIVDQMKKLKWTVEIDKFKDKTPIGELEFNNIITALNPNAERFLVLACHYDSKYMRERSFIGATDSAVPCAMLLNLASTFKTQLNRIKQRDDVSLKFIFFDGEEAFERWGPKDSIYGARHLARKLEDTPYIDNTANHLHRMDLLVLLDLIGAPDPTFYSYFSNTEKWYKRLLNAEKNLAESRLLTGYTYGMDGYPQHKYFQERSTYAGIEDDHIPFLHRGVPILHLIPHPFPSVWHTLDDNERALDYNTIDNLNKILRIFVAEYLQLEF